MGRVVDYLWIYVATAAVVVGLLRWRRLLRGVRLGWRRAARYRAVLVVLPALLSLGLSAWLCRERVPLPGVHDEFSYLLGADTFARGRLTTPPHPMREHFETAHVIQRPTYGSKYPPGQALALSLGQVLWKPILGAWLGVALAASAVAWALAAFVPARWALLAGVVTAIHPLMIEWTQMYWGGGLAALGGALVIGVAGRLAWRPRRQRLRITAGAALGVGLVILANTRLYEGLVVAVLMAALTLAWSRRRLDVRGAIRAVVLPAAAVLAVGLAWMGYHNFRVTGSPLVMPYAVHVSAYESVPVFAWQRPREIPLYHNPRLWALWAGWTFDDFVARRTTIPALLRDAGARLASLARHLFPSALMAVPLLMLPVMHLRSPRMRKVEIAALACAAASMVCAYFSPAYWAPAAVLGVLVYVQCLRYVAALRVKGFAVGQGIVAVMLVVLVITTAAWLREYQRAVRYPTWSDNRAAVLAELERRPGRHLVIVRYPPAYSVHDEWVYNPADIDAAPVLFAHDLGPRRNRRLLEYFADRHAWLVTPGSPHDMSGLTPYTSVNH